MKGYELKTQLTGCSHKISRTIIVPETLSFSELAEDLVTIYDLSFFNPSAFRFPGLNAPLNDNEEDIIIKDYLDLFKKFTWVYYSKNLTFNIKVKKTVKAESYCAVKSYEGKYNPLDYRSAYEFDEILYEIEAKTRDLEDITIFNIDKVNEKLKCKTCE